MTKLIAGTLIVVAIVFGFLWKHDGDAARDGQITLLERKHVEDMQLVDSLSLIVLRADAGTGRAIATFTVHDTAWRKHADTVEVTVARIVHDTTSTDSARIEQLAWLVTMTRIKADSAIRAAEALTDSVAQLRTDVADERRARLGERKTATAEIGLLKQQSRRWGLGASVGYDPLDLNLHKPRLNVGLVFRY